MGRRRVGASPHRSYLNLTDEQAVADGLGVRLLNLPRDGALRRGHVAVELLQHRALR